MTLKHTKRTLQFLEQHHDNCTVCKRNFNNDDTTHLGYTKSRKLIYVGDCCSKLLSETIIRHSFQKRPFIIPSDDTILWRFMDFAKFVSLLKTKSLFFSRVDKLGDPFEGAKGMLKDKAKWDKHHLDFFTEAIKTAPGNNKKIQSEKDILKDAKRLLNDLSQIGKKEFEETFVSCWYENSYESDAMWKLYTSSLEQGIAIKTTYKRLYNSLNRDPSIHIGRLNYIDYNKNFVGINEAFWFKRKSFEHEKEVRAIITDNNPDGDFGKLIPVNIDLLIDKVYLSPTCQDWFKDLVFDIMRKYRINKKSGLNKKKGLNKMIRSSEMAARVILN